MAKQIHQKMVAGRVDTMSLQRVAANKTLGASSSGDGLAAKLGAAAAVAAATERPWSEAEQRALEAGLKTYPSSLKSERWSNIAATLPGRSAEDCKRRFKSIARALKVSCVCRVACYTAVVTGHSHAHCV
jgi:hypothetical protein